MPESYQILKLVLCEIIKNSFPVRAIKAYRDLEVEIHPFLTSTVLEVRGQLHPAVAVSPGRGSLLMKREIFYDPVWVCKF
jgi:hypothetical protein